MKRQFFFLSFICVFVYSCSKENRCDCFKRTGDIIKEQRNIQGFNKILIYDNVNVFVTENNEYNVTVEAGKNIIPLIKTELDGNTLVLRNKNKCNWTRSYNKPLNVYISMPHIAAIRNEGTGNIQGMNTITGDSLDLEIANAGNINMDIHTNKMISHVFGSGDLTVSGLCAYHACDIGGTSYLHANNLSTSYTWIHSFTSGSADVYANDLIECFIDRSGDVNCYGHPARVEKTIKGNGNLYLK
jgi:Putative auto-transporter adhesin, head GIN domain